MGDIYYSTLILQIIERYLKRSKTSTSPQYPNLSVADGHHFTDPAQIPQSPSSIVAPNANENIYVHQQQNITSSAVVAQQQLIRPNAANSFSPYYSPPQSQTPHQQHLTNAHLMSSSPRISSPPPPGIGSLADSVLLGSPIQQQQHMHEYRY